MRTLLLAGCSCLQQCKHRGGPITAWFQSPAVCSSRFCSGPHTQSKPILTLGFLEVGSTRLKASATPRMSEPLWCYCALLFQMLCMCNLWNRSRKRKWAKGSQNQTVLLIIPVVGMESKVLSKLQLCVPWWLFFSSTATVLYLMYTAQNPLPWSLIDSFYPLAHLQSTALLCPLPSAILHWSLSPCSQKGY